MIVVFCFKSLSSVDSTLDSELVINNPVSNKCKIALKFGAKAEPSDANPAQLKAHILNSPSTGQHNEQ